MFFQSNLLSHLIGKITYWKVSILLVDYTGTVTLDLITALLMGEFKITAVNRVLHSTRLVFQIELIYYEMFQRSWKVVASSTVSFVQ